MTPTSRTRFRPALESLDGRIVPLGSPGDPPPSDPPQSEPPPTETSIALGRNEMVMVGFTDTTASYLARGLDDALWYVISSETGDEFYYLGDLTDDGYVPPGGGGMTANSFSADPPDPDRIPPTPDPGGESEPAPAPAPAVPPILGAPITPGGGQPPANAPQPGNLPPRTVGTGSIGSSTFTYLENGRLRVTTPTPNGNFVTEYFVSPGGVPSASVTLPGATISIILTAR